MQNHPGCVGTSDNSSANALHLNYYLSYILNNLLVCSCLCVYLLHYLCMQDFIHSNYSSGFFPEVCVAVFFFFSVDVLHWHPLPPHPAPPLTSPDGWTLPLAIHPSSPSSPAPLPANHSSPYAHVTDRGAGRWNSVWTIHRPERDGSSTAVASPHTNTHMHTNTGTQTEIYQHTFRKQACQSRGHRTAPL